MSNFGVLGAALGAFRESIGDAFRGVFPGDRSSPFQRSHKNRTQKKGRRRVICYNTLTRTTEGRRRLGNGPAGPSEHAVRRGQKARERLPRLLEVKR